MKRTTLFLPLLCLTAAFFPFNASALYAELDWLDISANGDSGDRGQDISVAPDSTIYVAGTHYGHFGGDYDEYLEVARFDPDGNLLWYRYYLGAFVGDNSGYHDLRELKAGPGHALLIFKADLYWFADPLLYSCLVSDDGTLYGLEEFTDIGINAKDTSLSLSNNTYYLIAGFLNDWHRFRYVLFRISFSGQHSTPYPLEPSIPLNILVTPFITENNPGIECAVLKRDRIFYFGQTGGPLGDFSPPLPQQYSHFFYGDGYGGWYASTTDSLIHMTGDGIVDWSAHDDRFSYDPEIVLIPSYGFVMAYDEPGDNNNLHVVIYDLYGRLRSEEVLELQTGYTSMRIKDIEMAPGHNLVFSGTTGGANTRQMTGMIHFNDLPEVPYPDPTHISAESREDAAVTTDPALTISPNPFNATTIISITLPVPGDLNLTVHNTLGQQVAELAHGSYSAGQHSFTLDGSSLASGIYFVHTSVPGNLDQIQKVVLMK
ncbi:T9SS type A sorting domain-containing protein [bacterium]|nr:T9SS type A sorting domain-containing protein [bacterium]